MSRIFGKTKQYIQSICVELGRRIPSKWAHGLYVLTNYILLGQWIKSEQLALPKRLANRYEVYNIVLNEIKEKKILYLEFGVAAGESMRYWSKTLTHPESILHGFDSFEGLPEDFDMFGSTVKGRFDQQGQFPKIDDGRIRFFKGWFDDTLPTYVVPPHDILVINMDADLYSSTKTIFHYIGAQVKVGTYIYFDDMGRVDHEPKALHEFIETTKLKFEVIAADHTCNKMFFRVVG